MSLSNVGSSTYTNDVTTQMSGSSQSKDAKNSQNTAKAAGNTGSDVGVVYEASKKGKEASKSSTSTAKKSNKVDSQTIARLKADSDTRLSQLKGIVEQLITKQGKASNNASIWSQFRQGILDGSITVDAATAKQAADDISEDGYWGVKQTSERILDFAKAISGGDSEKAEEMRSAIQKGFKAAAKLWGDKLPDISQRTYDAVMKGIDDWKNEESAQ